MPGRWSAASRAGRLRRRTCRPVLAALFGFLAVLLAATRLPAVRGALAAPDTVARLTLPHTLRVVGVVFLIVMALGDLPAAFALPAGLGDIAAGIAAPFVDLVVAVSARVVAGLLGITPSIEAVTVMPLVLIPALAVPTAVALHITALRKLAAVPRPDARADARVGAAA
ncbi:hypothetical protein AB0D27_38725 [Streptomyces sp. NPDC048415]|uniref:hypothetical protein n=1 Tax=Streptomyces sp. NPDC048415 TaxID=3154822 RepID=UPI00342F0DAA